tara:strand:+ start:133 stop:384 length:252 start_codon:yes stop_codon:yes gene_type:complete
MWCDELSKNIIKECIVEIDNKIINHHYLNSKNEIVTKHINKKKNLDIEERDIKLVMDKTNLNRERAIEELQKNDIVTILMTYM